MHFSVETEINLEVQGASGVGFELMRAMRELKNIFLDEMAS